MRHAAILSRSRQKATALIAPVIDWAFPARCPLCESSVAEHGALCTPCWNNIHFIEQPFCNKCGLPFGFEMGKEALCADCIQTLPNYDAARAVFRYDAGSRGLILPYKFMDKTQMTRTFGEWLLRAASDFPRADAIIPVPLHPKRLRQRKYNQSVLIGRALANAAKISLLPDALRRTRHTPPQAELSYAQRQDNVRGAFAVANSATPRIKDAILWLVDDVMTTCATVSACTQALQKAGAKAVYVLTLARTARDETGG